MLEYKTGDLFKEDVEAIVNTVNCVGVMGRGIALEFKRRFPDNYKKYRLECKNNKVKIGKMSVYEDNALLNPKIIINFPTKNHWRGKSQLSYIEEGLKNLVYVIEKMNIKSIAIPPLGCGLGGLDWISVKNLLDKYLGLLENINVIVFAPQIDFKNEKPVVNKVNMTKGRAALICLIYKYLEVLAEPYVSVLEIQKMLYFLQETGENLNLNYVKHIYGPYAENLRHVLSHIEGTYIDGYQNDGDKPGTEIILRKESYIKAADFISQKKDILNNLKQVFSIIEGFETPFGLELLSSVHWIVKETNDTEINGIVEKLHNWNSRKKMFTNNQVKIAYKVLKEHHWV